MTQTITEPFTFVIIFLVCVFVPLSFCLIFCHYSTCFSSVYSSSCLYVLCMLSVHLLSCHIDQFILAFLKSYPHEIQTAYPPFTLCTILSNTASHHPYRTLQEVMQNDRFTQSVALSFSEGQACSQLT